MNESESCLNSLFFSSRFSTFLKFNLFFLFLFQIIYFQKNLKCKLYISNNLFSKERCYVYNIFTTIITNNNLPFKICCKNVVDISFPFSKRVGSSYKSSIRKSFCFSLFFRISSDP